MLRNLSLSQRLATLETKLYIALFNANNIACWTLTRKVRL